MANVYHAPKDLNMIPNQIHVVLLRWHALVTPSTTLTQKHVSAPHQLLIGITNFVFLAMLLNIGMNQRSNVKVVHFPISFTTKIKNLANLAQVTNLFCQTEFVSYARQVHNLIVILILAKQYVFQIKFGIMTKKNVYALKKNHISVAVTVSIAMMKKSTIKIPIAVSKNDSEGLICL